MNYYEPIGFYDDGYGETFFPVVYVREDGVLERQLELLRQAGWKIIELSCEKFLKSSGSVKEITIWFMKKNIRMGSLFRCSLTRAGTGRKS